MKKLNYYFTLIVVLFITLFSFINMFQIVKLSNNVITIVLENLIPSLLPFMILISLCLSLGIISIFSYFIQFLFIPLFNLSPTMSSIYFMSFFCGYPTNVKIIKEAYEYNYITIEELQHLLKIASFSSISFIFISLKLEYPLVLYICHITPSILFAICHHKQQKYQTIKQTINLINEPKLSFVKAIKNSVTSSLYAFIFILGYMLVFQFISYALTPFIKNEFIIHVIQGILEFSSGSILLLQYPHTPFIYALVCFNLSFSGLSVIMQSDNLLEGIPYSIKKFIFSRIVHACLSFFITYITFKYFIL